MAEKPLYHKLLEHAGTLPTATIHTAIFKPESYRKLAKIILSVPIEEVNSTIEQMRQETATHARVEANKRIWLVKAAKDILSLRPEAKRDYLEMIEPTVARPKRKAAVEKPRKPRLTVAGVKERKPEKTERKAAGEKEAPVTPKQLLSAKLRFLRKSGLGHLKDYAHKKSIESWVQIVQAARIHGIPMEMINTSHVTMPTDIIDPAMKDLAKKIGEERKAEQEKLEAARKDKTQRALTETQPVELGRREKQREEKRLLLQESGFGHVAKEGRLGIASLEKMKRRITIARQFNVKPSDVNPPEFGYSDKKFAETMAALASLNRKKAELDSAMLGHLKGNPIVTSLELGDIKRRATIINSLGAASIVTPEDFKLGEGHFVETLRKRLAEKNK